MLSVTIGGFVWYSSRPKPPKPWDLTALVAKESPSFSLSHDGKNVELHYPLENTTTTDYEIDSHDRLKIMFKTDEGTFSHPLSIETASVTLPIFIPAQQKGFVTLSIALSGIPAQKLAESDDEFHERLRTHLESHLKGITAFVIFEDTNRYQINLPRVLSKRPKEN